MSAIEWTDETWNPVTGCSRVSPGCEHCYAETLSLRRGWSTKPWTAQNAAENVVLHPERLEKPLRWRKPRMVFVNSMSDLFHERIPDEYIDKVFAMMALTSRHTFQVLTKRHERMHDYVTEMGTGRGYDRLESGLDGLGYSLRYEGIPLVPWPIPNAWLGVSVEDQRRADERIPILLDTPAAIRWISAEPLLEEITVGSYFVGPSALDWVVVGGESGPDSRPMDVAWVRKLHVETVGAGVPLFVKQDSGRLPGKQGRIPDELWIKEYPA